MFQKLELARMEQEMEESEQLFHPNFPQSQPYLQEPPKELPVPENKRPFKTTSTAAKLAARLSPKAQRKKPNQNIALMKVI